MLKRWLNSEYILTHTHSILNFSNAILPRAYGLSKIHKSGIPLRIIIFSFGSPLHNLANFVQEILSLSFPSFFSHIHNNLDLLKKLMNLRCRLSLSGCGFSVHQHSCWLLENWKKNDHTFMNTPVCLRIHLSNQICSLIYLLSFQW